MGEKTQRVIIWIITILFIVSTFGVLVYYVLANRQQEKQQGELLKATQEIQQQQTQQQTNNPQVTKLTGTKLANYEPVTPIKQLQGQDTTLGSGAEVKSGDVVTVKYVGALATNGTIFDASGDHEGGVFTFKVGGGQVIKGWDLGVPGMKSGGKRRILIPANLGYGSQAVGTTIPANSDLVFDVEVVKIGS